MQKTVFDSNFDNSIESYDSKLRDTLYNMVNSW